MAERLEGIIEHINERLGSIERRLDGLEARMSGMESRLLYVGGALGLLMSVYKFL